MTKEYISLQKGQHPQRIKDDRIENYGAYVVFISK